ncbi:MAG: hypothetical protein H6772_01880 [Pseudomonadales bacterium]|nr:hypothetical protein [Pseudomonadales bacterium]
MKKLFGIEGFYGIRLYKGDDGLVRVGVCIQRMDLTVTVKEFQNSGIVENIKQLRKQQITHFHELFGSFVVSE